MLSRPVPVSAFVRLAALLFATALVVVGSYSAERFHPDAGAPSVPTYTIQVDDLAMDEGASTPIGMNLPDLCGALLGILLFVLLLLRPKSWAVYHRTPLPPWSIETDRTALAAVTPLQLGISRT